MNDLLLGVATFLSGSGVIGIIGLHVRVSVLCQKLLDHEENCTIKHNRHESNAKELKEDVVGLRLKLNEAITTERENRIRHEQNVIRLDEIKQDVKEIKERY